MYGYNGKILIVDLTTKTYEIEDLNMDWAKLFIGGASLGGRYLFDLMPAKTDAFDPDSVIGFISGPTNGTKALLGARITIVCKSPVTDGWNDSSCGGTFGPYMRKSGFDAVFFKGKSENPVYLFIDDGKIEFHDASDIWLKTTEESEHVIKETVGKDCSVMQIGPGGAHLSLMAAVINECTRAAGRGGSGAVMGSKNLKALVCRGTKKIEVYDEKALMACNQKCLAHGKPGGAAEAIVPDFMERGTSGEYDSCVVISDAPIKNWGGTPDDIGDEKAEALAGRFMDPVYKVKKEGCMSCYIKCGAIYKVDEHGYKLEEATRPEYESLGCFGSMLLNGDPGAAIICNWLCNMYGYDTMSFGSTIAWLMECYENKLFTQEELNGIDLQWGDPEAIIKISEAICNYEGIGVELNLASRGAARALGRGEEYLVTAGGIELPMHGARFNPGLARIFQYDPSPGRHIKGGRGVPYGNLPPEVKYVYDGTGKDDAAGLLEWEFVNASGVCGFGNFLLSPMIDIEYIAAITGFTYTEEELTQFAYRCFTLRHAFNLREGYRRWDFKIDGRAVGKPPMKSGPLEGITLDNEKLADNFYEYLGWDIDTSVPPKEFLDTLGGLEFVSDFLYPEAS